MVTIKKYPLSEKEWQEYIEAHSDCTDYSSGYDYSQHGDRYIIYMFRDLAYWDALVCYDPFLKEVVATISQVINSEEAEEHLLRYLKEEENRLVSYYNGL